MFYAYKENNLICGSDKKETVIKICKNLKITDYEITDYEKIASKEKTLEELKAEKLAELTAITSKFDNQLVNNEMIINSSLGFSINADLRSQNNLRGLIAVGVEPVNFVTADNSVKSLSIAELNTLLNECAQNGQHLYLLKWQYREQIEQAKTAKELKSIELNFAMKDFSEVSA